MLSLKVMLSLKYKSLVCNFRFSVRIGKVWGSCFHLLGMKIQKKENHHMN